MKKISYIITIPYAYNADRNGSHYTLDGGKTYKNNGEFLESVAKHYRGLDYMVNPSTSYDNGSDIPELNASVKSSGATLASITGETVEDILKTYFERVHSTLWIYMVRIDDTATEYHMNRAEFERFLRTWYKVDKDRNGQLKVRFKKTGPSMVRWLESYL